MKSLSCLVLLLLTYLPLEAQVADSLKYISLWPHDFHHQYSKTDSSILIDVREPFEFMGNRIRGAVNIPASGNLDKVADSLNKETSLFIYCTSGFRSSNAAIKLYEKGFRKLYNLEGGIKAWRKEGLRVIKGRERRAEGRGPSVKISQWLILAKEPDCRGDLWWSGREQGAGDKSVKHCELRG